MEYYYHEESYRRLYIYEYILKSNETMHLENILTRKTTQLGYSGIFECNGIY